MIRRRTIKGVLHNFLGTYTSRYSDYDGYWLFGMLVADLRDLHIDLLSSTGGTTETTPLAVVTRLAIQRFREQMEKAGLTASFAREAHLYITRLPDLQNGFVNGRVCPGYKVQFLAKVISDYGKTYEREMTILVAIHDPQIEQRSTRGKS